MKSRLLGACVCSLFLVSANAVAVTLPFEGLQNNEDILEFYNGGSGSLGSSGPDLGIRFSPNAVAFIDIDAGGSGNFANEPSPDTAFMARSTLTMNVGGGFTGGFSFFYTSNATATVTVHDGLDGTGTVVATLSVDPQSDLNCSGDPTGAFCNWSPIGASFVGTAMSVRFQGPDQSTFYDNVTLGSDTPTVPLPAALYLFGSGLIGLIGITRRRRAA